MNPLPLQPLRIPPGWTVDHNTFFEVDPSESTTEFLCEDLFQATCTRTNVLLDLGWYPDGDPTGRFVIEAYAGDFSGPRLLRFETPTRLGAVSALETALWEHHHGPPR